MENTTRDRTQERRDRDDPGWLVVPPPQTPTPDASAHMPGSATELAEVSRALQKETVGKKDRPE